jgi:hypothetical protein
VVFKRQKFIFKQRILKIIFKKIELKLLIYKSLLRNHYNHYMFRLSFCINIFFLNKNNCFKTLQKLVCPFTLGKKVPNKDFSYSRFFLNQTLNSLNICNTYS